MTTLLIKQLGFQCSRVAVADDERTHELKTRAASRTPASATGASDLLVGGGLVRARPPPTLLASGCASAPCGLPFQLGGDTALKKRIRRGMLRWAGRRSLEILIEGGWRGSAERGARGIQFFIKRFHRKRYVLAHIMLEVTSVRFRKKLYSQGSGKRSSFNNSCEKRSDGFCKPLVFVATP